MISTSLARTAIVRHITTEIAFVNYLIIKEKLENGSKKKKLKLKNGSAHVVDQKNGKPQLSEELQA